MAGKKTGKRLLTWVLVLVMALSLLPLNALAKDVRSTEYGWIQIYLDDATNSDLQDLNGMSKQVRIVSSEYPSTEHGMRACAPLSNYWWTENNVYKVTANKITHIVLAGDKAIGGSNKIPIPIQGNEIYEVKVSEGYHEGITSLDSYYYLRIDISKRTPEPPVTDEVTVTIKGNTDIKTYDGTEKTVTGYTVESISNPLYKDTDFTFNGTAEATGTDAGNYEMGLKDSDFENNNNNFKTVKFVVTDGTLTINKRSVTLTSASDSKVYDGTPLTKPEVTVTGDGFVDGEVTDITAIGSVTNVSEGEVTNTIEYTTTDNFKADNYTITEELGTLTITPLDVTVTIKGNTGTYEYDGTEKTVEGYTLDISNNLYKASDVNLVNSQAKISATVPGTYAMGLTPGNFENTNPNFNVTFVVKPGKLTIENRPITITADDVTVKYDGQPHGENGYSITAGSLVDSHAATVTISGSETDAGKYEDWLVPSVTKIVDAENKDVTGYYDISCEDGFLTIKPRSVTLTSETASKVYDGTPLTKPEVKVTGDGFVEGEVTDIRATGSVTHVSEGEVTNTITFTKGQKFKDSNYTITKTEGKLTITEASAPAPVTINLSDYIKKDLKVIGSGFQGETFTVTVTGDSESGGGQFTGSVTYAANEGNASLKAFTDWKVVHSPTGDNYVFNDNGTITFKKVTTGTAYSFTVDEAKGGTEEMDYDGSSRSFNVWVGTDKESGKLKITKTSKPITLENHYNGTFPVALGQYIKKVYKSECSCAPETTFRFEALIEERVPEANALSLIESVPVEKESKVYTAKGSVTLKAGTEQTADMSIQLPEGFYEVTLKEVNDKTANVKYDKTVYTFGISVLEDGGNVKIGFFDVKKDGKEYNEQGFVFTNSYVHSHFIPVSPKPSKPTLNTGDHYAYVMGYPDGTVRPNGSITRAEVSTILFRLLSDKTRDEYFTTESSFTDVKAGAWYNNSIATLEKAGVIVDTAKGGAFRPNEAITRAELAAMLAQFSDAKPVKGVKFSDVPAEHWAYEAIAIAAKMGWIEGYPDGTFRPDATITRAEMMTLVNRALERVPSDEDHLLSKRVMLTFPDCKSGDWFYIAVQEATNSHTYERAATEKNGDEQWTALRANRDWTLLEK